MATDGIENEYQKVLENAGIDNTTCDLLKANGFDSKLALSAMELSDVAKVNVKPLGQRRLLERLLKNLTLQEKEITNSEPQTGGGNEIRETRLDTATQLDTLSATGQQSRISPEATEDTGGNTFSLGNFNQRSSIHELQGDLDPLIYLADNKHADCLNIVDFVPTDSVNEYHEQVMSSQNGNEVVLKSGPRKPKLETVTPMQWTAANARIMAKLLQEGKLGPDQVSYYLAYTVKIAGLAQRYLWQSVLVYDREYRWAQCVYKFPWGSDVPHLITAHLVPRQPQSAKRYDVKRSQISDSCRLFNHKQCGYGDSCKYKHVCSLCGANHPQSQHGNLGNRT